MTRSAQLLRSSARIGSVRTSVHLELASLSDARNTRIRNRRSCATGVFTLLATVLAATPWATGDTWLNTGNPNWSTGSNWADGSEPASTAEAVTFPVTSGFYNPSVTLSSGEVCASLTFNASMTLGLGTLNVGAAGGPISVSSFGPSTINSALNGTQGLTKNGAGTLTLGGANTFIGAVNVNAGTLSINADSRLGNSGNSVLINDGTLQTTSNFITSRTVTVTGSGSNLTADLSSSLGIGNSGTTGALNITAGGQVQSGQGQLGSLAGSIGTVTVDGADSTWITAGTNPLTLVVGISGSGILDIRNGGLVQAVNCATALDNDSSANISVDGPDSRFICSEQLSLGQSAAAVLSITNGGLVQTASGRFGGGESTSSGTATVSGANSRWVNSGTLTLCFGSASGGSGPATLTILTGGTVTLGGDILGPAVFNGTNVSTLTLDGGTLDMQGHQIGIAGGATVNTRNFRSGTLRNVAQINNGAALTKTTAGTLILDTANGYTGGTAVNGGVLHVSNADGSATGTGTVTVASVATLQGTGFIGGPVQNNGSVAPGASAGILTIENSYTQSAGGTLEIEIGGTTLGSQYDSLTIVDNAALDGIVDVALVNGFLPVAGQQFTILTATSIVDNGLALGGSAASSFSLLVNSSSVILQAIGLPGDYNNNGTVDAADYVLWRNGGPLINEVDTPGVVNTADYTEWRARFGNPSSGNGAGTTANIAVPESSTLVLLILAVAGACLRRHRAVHGVSKLDSP